MHLVFFNLFLFLCRITTSSGVEQMEDEGLDSDGDVELADSDAEGEDSDADEDLAIEMDDARAKADEMGVEHLATLERLRQNQRQDYLKVMRISFCFLCKRLLILLFRVRCLVQYRLQIG